MTYYKKILKIKFEYWLPGRIIEAGGTRQPVDISINENKLQVSKIAQTHTRDTHKGRETFAINITINYNQLVKVYRSLSIQSEETLSQKYNIVKYPLTVYKCSCPFLERDCLDFHTLEVRRSWE